MDIVAIVISIVGFIVSSKLDLFGLIKSLVTGTHKARREGVQDAQNSLSLVIDKYNELNNTYSRNLTQQQDYNQKQDTRYFELKARFDTLEDKYRHTDEQHQQELSELRSLHSKELIAFMLKCRKELIALKNTCKQEIERFALEIINLMAQQDSNIASQDDNNKEIIRLSKKVVKRLEEFDPEQIVELGVDTSVTIKGVDTKND